MGSPQSASLPWGFLPSDLGASMAGDGASASETANHLGQILSQEGRAGLGWAGLGPESRLQPNEPQGLPQPRTTPNRRVPDALHDTVLST